MRMKTLFLKGIKLPCFKDVVIFFWLLNSTIYLYFLNSIETKGVMDFFKFTALLFGAGVTYDILLKLRAFSSDAKRLKRIIEFFLLMAITCQMVSMIIFCFVWGEEGGHEISLGISFIGIFGAIYIAVRLGPILDKMIELENL